MFFDLKPEHTPKELFGREQVLNGPVKTLNGCNWVVVIGPRIVGTTSLIKVANSKIAFQTVYVDLW